MVQQADVLIVGGGVSGLAAAARLGAEGRRVLVVDRAALPRDKVCGEGLMPLGLAALRTLGLEPEALPGQAFLGLEYRSRTRGVALDFRPGAAGRGVPRTELVAALHRLATRHGGRALHQRPHPRTDLAGRPYRRSKG